MAREAENLTSDTNFHDNNDGIGMSAIVGGNPQHVAAQGVASTLRLDGIADSPLKKCATGFASA
jgi:hypothetical protein